MSRQLTTTYVAATPSGRLGPSLVLSLELTNASDQCALKYAGVGNTNQYLEPRLLCLVPTLWIVARLSAHGSNSHCGEAQPGRDQSPFCLS